MCIYGSHSIPFDISSLPCFITILSLLLHVIVSIRPAGEEVRRLAFKPLFIPSVKSMYSTFTPNRNTCYGTVSSVAYLHLGSNLGHIISALRTRPRDRVEWYLSVRWRLVRVMEMKGGRRILCDVMFRLVVSGGLGLDDWLVSMYRRLGLSGARLARSNVDTVDV